MPEIGGGGVGVVVGGCLKAVEVQVSCRATTKVTCRHSRNTVQGTCMYVKVFEVGQSVEKPRGQHGESAPYAGPY